MARKRRIHAGGIFERPVILLTTVAAILFLGWVWLVASFHLHEMIVGAAVVALSTAFCGLVFSSATLPLELRWRDVLQVWRAPTAIVQDTGILLTLLFRDLFLGQRTGSFYRVCGFRSSRRDPVVVGRSALAIMYTTMSPNMIVIGIDPTQSHLLFHQVQRDAVPRLTQNLGAGR